MRAWPVALAVVLVVAGAMPAWAKSQQVKVKVQVKVARACTVHAPSAAITSTGAAIAVASLLADCTDENIPALLTIVRDSADNRTDVATINF